MKPWTVEFTTEVKKDMRDLSRTQRLQINKAILKVSKNPLPNSEGGYGKPLGNKQSKNLTGSRPRPSCRTVPLRSAASFTTFDVRIY